MRTFSTIYCCFLFISTSYSVKRSWNGMQLHPQLQRLYQGNHNQIVASYGSAMQGTWSAWSQWTPCSRTCGRGVTIQSRECRANHNSVTAVSKTSSTCVGQYKRYQFCNIVDCSGTRRRDFRKEQCAAFNKRSFRGRHYRWEPLWLAANPCELNCRPKRARYYVTLSKSVIDGTSCFKNSRDSVCIGGMCKQLGCDGVIGSTRKLDHCGVCGGDNSTCRIVSGFFTMSQLPYGYNLVATIPKGACNLNITELKPSRNYLALRGSNGSYILNGNWAINWSGSYDALGTVFNYKRDDDSLSTDSEQLTAKGPIKEAVDMMVLSQHTNPGIKYEYTLPLRSSPITEWTPHPPPPLPPLSVSSGLDGSTGHGHRLGSVAGGGGNHQFVGKQQPPPPHSRNRTSLQHHGRHNRRRSHHKSNRRQHDAPPADDVATLDVLHQGQQLQQSRLGSPFSVPLGVNYSNGNNFGGPFAWRTSGFTDCSRKCGGGTQKSLVVCVNEHSLAVVADHNCNAALRPDSQSVPCNTRPCPPEWVTSDWSECSATCGDGIQTREVSCKQTVTATLQVAAADAACVDSRPETLRRCHPRPCYKWKAEEWGECSVRCGKGVRRRQMRCLNAVGQTVPSSYCAALPKPSDEEGCDMGFCSHKWLFTEWSSLCFADCGMGMQTRKVYCSSEAGYTRHACDPSTKPEQAQSCASNKSCNHGKWFTGPWNQCSASCGPGIKRRDVFCLSLLRGQYTVALDSMCIAEDKPSAEQPCTVQHCHSEWYMSEWNQCSQTCDSGYQTREVRCLDENQKPSQTCDDESKRPPTKRDCNTAKCTDESQGDSVCEDKYHHCRLVVQSRLCRYDYYRNMCCDSCYNKHR